MELLKKCIKRFKRQNILNHYVLRKFLGTRGCWSNCFHRKENNEYDAHLSFNSFFKIQITLQKIGSWNHKINQWMDEGDSSHTWHPELLQTQCWVQENIVYMLLKFLPRGRHKWLLQFLLNSHWKPEARFHRSPHGWTRFSLLDFDRA